MDDVPARPGPGVVTLGNFDGVHAGHRAVLARVVEVAKARSAQALAVTFDPHPLQVLHPDRAPALITGLDQRLTLMAATGLDATLIMEFTTALAGWSAERFVSGVLVQALRAQVVVVGPDTRFGHRNTGDVNTLRTMGRAHGFEVQVVEELTPGDVPRRWSSSWIREQLTAGDVEAAALGLGRPHRVSGEVVHGDHRGRELGYPTANLGGPVEGLVPADGVYAGWLLRRQLSQDAPDRVLPTAVSIGTNPTFGGVGRRVEAHVLDRTDLDLYGQRVDVELVRRLRPMSRFAEVADLVAQMAVDVEGCRRALGAVVPSVGDRRR
jgi:riboflavin kinase / FMN adenylyltransferase